MSVLDRDVERLQEENARLTVDVERYRSVLQSIVDFAPSRQGMGTEAWGQIASFAKKTAGEALGGNRGPEPERKPE